jgi:AcrR family transcriptional regulator
MYFRMNIGKVGRVTDPVKSRVYRSSVRAAQAQRTRRAILDAARGLFSTQGYAATTVSQIAAGADVAVDTVYAAVGTKSAVFRLLLETAISGTDQAIPADEREYVRRLRAEPSARGKLKIYAGAVRIVAERMAPLQLVLRDAAAQEPELARMRDEISHRRAGNMHRLAEELIATGELRSGLEPDEVADVIWSTSSAEFYALLVRERGWSSAQFEEWLTFTWGMLFLAKRPRRRTTQRSS